MITFQGYSVAHPDALETPAMLLFQDRLEHNIRSACEMVGGQNLMAHVKTHKSEAITRKQIEAGIHGFKCATLNELAMVLKAGARKAILAYPVLPGRVDRYDRQYRVSRRDAGHGGRAPPAVDASHARPVFRHTPHGDRSRP